MPWSITDIPDQTGRVAVVTGANGGLGLVTASALAGAGAHVVMAARDPDKTADARASILAAHPGASLEVVPLDLASQEGTREAAARIAASHDQVDLLINNAGVMAMPERRTEDGFETQLAIDHLGHWTLTDGLLAPLVRADRARVVTVTSFARHSGRRIDPDNPHLEGRYDDWGAYGQAKLANLHFALGLDRQLRAAGVRARSLAAHPGLAHTDLQKRTVREGGGGSAGPFWERVTADYGMPAERAALPQLRAATDPRAKGGQLYGPRWVVTGRAVRLPLYRRIGLSRSIEVLWDVSQRLTGASMTVPTVVGT
ncbi:oxidoreductase [Demequina activiva]|uniref:Short-chain dehydrogenase/reductase n=1 Tax=Demequina activiva TaxID=1582364 RepID=A0A919Q1X7_9MICO|nr:oxidoreductase [Demequina activiva]GIG54376.1 putative short-chain dehydrogenase/reductase [Demequina activiva]